MVGADEVGRGAWAGPVVAGAVAFPEDVFLPEDIKIDDSKKLTSKQREKASYWIKKNAICWGIGEVSVSVINKLGLAKATQMAFRRAISACQGEKNFLLVDAFYVSYVKGLRRKRQHAIVDGDEKSISIAAASILAKVERDKIMQRLGKRHPEYKWAVNKGYGTRKHQEALKELGETRLHRSQFVKSWLLKD